jgi:3-methyladenine DNA glycosylase/8-oxoguanine DNA glycosylase
LVRLNERRDEQEAPTAEQMEGLTESWRPYRSLGSYYMWRLIGKKGASQRAAKVAAKGKSKTATVSEVPI